MSNFNSKLYKALLYIRSLAGKNAYNHISVDESLFFHLNNKPQWVIGLKNYETKDIRLEIVENRDTDTLKQIIEKHVLSGNYITTDAWKGYTFLDYPYSGYIHDVYNHARGNFGSGLSSTSRIEGLWRELKSLLKKIKFTQVQILIISYIF